MPACAAKHCIRQKHKRGATCGAAVNQLGFGSAVTRDATGGGRLVQWRNGDLIDSSTAALCVAHPAFVICENLSHM